jgi:chromatin remodeling complex protein RSC6
MSKTEKIVMEEIKVLKEPKVKVVKEPKVKVVKEPKVKVVKEPKVKVVKEPKVKVVKESYTLEIEDEVVEDEVVGDEVVGDEVVGDEVVEKEKKVRTIPTKESVRSEFEDILKVVEEEILRIRENPSKFRGVKFLRSFGKKVKVLKNHTDRVMKQKHKTNRTNNANSGFLKPVCISKEMANFTGWDVNKLRSRVEVTKFICDYVRDKDLQNPKDRRQILPDEALSNLLCYSLDSELPLTYYRIQSYMKTHFHNPVTQVTV